MPSKAVKEKRDAWQAKFDPRVPLSQQLGSPFVPAWQIAHVMGVSESTVYSSAKRYYAAMTTGASEAIGPEVPCIILGSSHRFPTAAFVEWFEHAGQASEGPPVMPHESDTRARAGAGGHELVVTVRLVLEDGVLHALAEMENSSTT